MSESGDEKQTDEATEGISDDQLPEDLQPSEDNPLAEPLPEEERPDDPAELDMDGGKSPEQSGTDDEDSDDDGASGGDDTDD